jgi:hypothetical protein
VIYYEDMNLGAVDIACGQNCNSIFDLGESTMVTWVNPNLYAQDAPSLILTPYNTGWKNPVVVEESLMGERAQSSRLYDMNI